MKPTTLIKAAAIIIAILFVLFLNQCNRTNKIKRELKYQISSSTQNLASKTDSIRRYKNLVGDVSFSKPIAQMTPEQLKLYYPELYNKFKAEQQIKILWYPKIEYKDTGSVKNSVAHLSNDDYAIIFNYLSQDSNININVTNYFKAKAQLIKDNNYNISLTPGVSVLNNISLKVGFVTGIKKEGDLYKIFLTPLQKNIITTQLEGADVTNLLTPPIQKKRRWGIGPYIGIDIISLKPNFGLSINYSIIRF